MRFGERTWISIATIILIGLLLFFARHELATAWKLLNNVNLWILSLFIPVVILSYLASGEMIFSYLRQKKLVKHLSPFTLMRMSFELNFVNHALPSGGASGVSYMTWRLGKIGVKPARATSAQLVRFVAGFASFAVLLVIAVFLITIDGGINRWIILVSSTLVSLMTGATIAGIYFVQNRARIRKAAKFSSRAVNAVVKKITFGRREQVLSRAKAEEFLEEMHEDYLELKRDKSLLWQPFWWGIVFLLLDAAMFWIAFWFLGTIVNPATILIAYGLATLAGFIVVTPGGSGAYEALMVGFLAIAGVSQGVAIAGVLLARVLILLTILILGYAFYQQAVIKYGKPKQT